MKSNCRHWKRRKTRKRTLQITTRRRMGSQRRTERRRGGTSQRPGNSATTPRRTRPWAAALSTKQPPRPQTPHDSKRLTRRVLYLTAACHNQALKLSHLCGDNVLRAQVISGPTAALVCAPSKSEVSPSTMYQPPPSTAAGQLGSKRLCCQHLVKKYENLDHDLGLLREEFNNCKQFCSKS